MLNDEVDSLKTIINSLETQNSILNNAISDQRQSNLDVSAEKF